MASRTKTKAPKPSAQGFCKVLLISCPEKAAATPASATLWRVLIAVDPAVLQDAVGTWLRQRVRAHADARGAASIDEMPIGVGIVEVLRDRRVGAGLDLALEIGEVVFRTARLRMIFGIGRDVDVEPVAGFLADEPDEVAREAEIPRIARARRVIAPQRHDVPDAVRLVFGEHVADGFARTAHAGDVRRRLEPRAPDLQNGFQRAGLRRAVSCRAEGPSRMSRVLS